MSDPSLSTPIHPAARGHRLWFPAIVAALAAVSITIIRLQPELERNFKSWLTSAVVILAQARSMLVDLMELTGLDYADARELVPDMD